MRLNYRLSGSPVHIPVSYLHADLYTLNHLIAERRFAQTTKPGHLAAADDH